jgi:hypothetical protein
VVKETGVAHSNAVEPASSRHSRAVKILIWLRCLSFARRGKATGAMEDWHMTPFRFDKAGRCRLGWRADTQVEVPLQLADRAAAPRTSSGSAAVVEIQQAAKSLHLHRRPVPFYQTVVGKRSCAPE